MKYLKLMRVKHYIKNALILLPIFFSRNLLDFNLLLKGIMGFFAFSFLSSFVYIVNDINDIEKDRAHPSKKNRPIASGTISVKFATILAVFILILALLLNYYIVGFKSSVWVFFILYLFANLAYSFGLKNVALLDVVILVSGFLLRLLYGASLLDIEISNWLYLTVMSMSFYLGLGKRRNELLNVNANTRKVLKNYSSEFLDKNMYICLTLTIVFYALWTVDPSNSGANLIWTVPLVLIICMKYSLNIESESIGDPIEILFKDYILMGLVCIFVIIMVLLLYL